MKRNSQQKGVRGRSTVTLLLVVAVVVTVVVAIWRPWYAPASDERLRARLDRYVALRKAGDWQGLYAMTDPHDRRVVDYAKFHRFYGQEMTRLHSITVKEARMDDASKTANMELDVEVELVPENLPATFRRSLKVDDRAALRQRSNVKLDWVWRGDWYFGMDRVVLTGRDKEGRVVRHETKPADAPPAASPAETKH
jgi:hypothetical protein